MLHGVSWIEKFYNLETTFIDIEMNIAYLKMRGVRFPNFRIWIGLLNSLSDFQA